MADKFVYWKENYRFKNQRVSKYFCKKLLNDIFKKNKPCSHVQCIFIDSSNKLSSWNLGRKHKFSDFPTGPNPFKISRKYIDSIDCQNMGSQIKKMYKEYKKLYPKLTRLKLRVRYKYSKSIAKFLHSENVHVCKFSCPLCKVF